MEDYLCYIHTLEYIRMISKLDTSSDQLCFGVKPLSGRPLLMEESMVNGL